MQQLFPIVFDWLNFATIHRTSDFGHPARTQVFRKVQNIGERVIGIRVKEIMDPSIWDH
jgi:hypothetical protein